MPDPRLVRLRVELFGAAQLLTAEEDQAELRELLRDVAMVLEVLEPGGGAVAASSAPAPAETPKARSFHRVEADYSETRHVVKRLEATDRADAARQLRDAAMLLGIGLENIEVTGPGGLRYAVVDWCEACDGPIWDDDPEDSWYHDQEDPIVLHTACGEAAAAVSDG